MSNTTQATYIEEFPITTTDIVMCVLSFSLMVFVCSGNFLTLMAVARTAELRVLANLYVCSLAVTDLIVGLGFGMTGFFSLPPIKEEYFDKNNNLCVYFLGSNTGSFITSSFHMTLISFDRYIYITRPYLHPRLFTKNKIIIALTIIWSFGVFLVVVPQFTYIDVAKTQDCDLHKSLPTWYVLYLSTATFVVNILVACVLYGQILFIAFRQRKSLKVTVKPTVGTGHIHNEVKPQPSEPQNKSFAWKSIKFFFTIFGFYIVCFTPTIITAMVERFHTLNETIGRASIALTMLNSGMNFIIYAVINKQFRRAFSDILHCRPSSQ